MLKALILSALLLPATALAQTALLSLEDPAGDDNGNGALIHRRVPICSRATSTCGRCACFARARACVSRPRSRTRSGIRPP
jgi:hypothetical protein